MAPPSRHISGGSYQWMVGKSLAPIPPWLITALQSPPKPPGAAQDWLPLVRHGVTEGNRNNAAARLAGHLMRRYVDPQVTLELLQAWNCARCSPPLPTSEITTIVNSIAKLELERRQAS